MEMRGRATRLREVSAAMTRMLRRRAQFDFTCTNAYTCSKSYSCSYSCTYSYSYKAKPLQTRSHTRVL